VGGETGIPVEDMAPPTENEGDRRDVVVQDQGRGCSVGQVFSCVSLHLPIICATVKQHVDLSISGDRLHT
jgi:hypothetical protein